MKTITIKDKEYKIKYSIRALFIFEQITGKPFKIETLLDNYIFFYSMILANNKDEVLDWNDFLDALDDNPNLLEEMNEIVISKEKQDKVFNVEEENGEKKS